VRCFEFRARRPLFVNQPLHLVAYPAVERIDLAALAPDGAVALSATVTH
jgi:hydroxyacyl-ACP dehydratase HTD2-like protein with hotdog domain